MTTRAIRTSTQQDACDVCGRTLLRGERAEIYLSGTDRRSVCELCTSRALHGGWIREGTVPDYVSAADRDDRRRSLFGRRRGRRDGEGAGPETDENLLDGVGAPPAPREPDSGSAPEWPDSPVRSSSRRLGGRRRRTPAEPASGRHEPRHVRAVPTSVEQRIAAAVALFNGSEHPRTVAGIARSLGLPDVSVHPTDPVASVVNIVVAWELCWYRYEVDLSDHDPSVRKAGQGYELSELAPVERQLNATADERGRLDLR